MSLRVCVPAVCLFVSVVAAPSLLGQTSPARSGAGIEGSIVDDVLTLLKGVHVTLHRSGNLVASQQTDASGWFRFRGLATGTYELSTELAGHARVAKTATIRRGSSVM